MSNDCAVTRAKYFQDAIKETGQPLEIEAVRALIEQYVHTHTFWLIKTDAFVDSCINTTKSSTS